MLTSTTRSIAASLVSLLAIFIAGCSGEPASEDEETDGEGSALHGGKIDPKAPASFVEVSQGLTSCNGIAVSKHAVLTSAECVTSPDMPNLYKVGTLDRSGKLEAGLGLRYATRIELVGPTGEEPLALLFVDLELERWAKLPTKETASGTTVKIYGSGYDRERGRDSHKPSGYVQSKELRWGKGSSAVNKTFERGAPILLPNETLAGIVVDSRWNTFMGTLATGWIFGDDIVLPLVSDSGDTAVVDQIREALDRKPQ